MNDTNEPIKCERRSTCALNAQGLCTLSSPRIDKRFAYVSCLDQTENNPNNE